LKILFFSSPCQSTDTGDPIISGMGKGRVRKLRKCPIAKTLIKNDKRF
jgi:hypothetical protein